MVSCQDESSNIRFASTNGETSGKTERTAYGIYIYLEMSYDRVPRQKVDMYDGKGSATEVSKDNTGYV